MKHARADDNEEIPINSKSARISDMNFISLEEKMMFKVVKMIITELNDTFDVKVYSSDKYSIRNFPTYVELSCATSVNTYNTHETAIAQHLKNKPKYVCNLINREKLPIILNYFTNKKIISLNMEYIENNKCLLSFMLSPYKESIFFEDMTNVIGPSYKCDFIMSVTADISDEIGHSLFLCKYCLCTCCCYYYNFAYIQHCV